MSGWQPPGKNCGRCGCSECSEFTELLKSGKKVLTDCPFYIPGTEPHLRNIGRDTEYKDTDIVGNYLDFILHALPGEPSARKVVQPFRPDLVEKWNIIPGDIVLGRPEGAGCPVQHVLSVIDADPVTGVLTTHVVSPLIARDPKAYVKDVKAYNMIAFEGIAETKRNPPVFGMRQRFLPGYCMMHLGHTGVVNMVLKKPSGTHIRVEDIII
jgi:uncharacterized Fe-S cluster-containing protein